MYTGPHDSVTASHLRSDYDSSCPDRHGCRLGTASPAVSVSYLIEENRILKAQLGNKRLRLTDTERRRLAALAHPLGRARLKEMATIATPNTLMRWYQRLIAQ